MAWHLYRLGRWSFRRRRIVLSFWIGLLLLMGVGAGTLSGKTSDEFTIPGIESIDAFDLIKERTPDAAPDGATARIVFQAPEGEQLSSPQYQAAIDESLASIDSPNVVAPLDAAALTTSEDGRTGFATVSYAKQSVELTDADKTALEESPEPAEAAGLTVAVGGDALQEIPAQGLTELIGLGVAVVVLLITFGSLLLAGMPLLTAIVGVGIGVAGIQVATGFIDLGSSTPTLALMLGLAVGIDYALFIASRYRHEVHMGRPRDEAAGRAVGTAGSAVVFAGLTVIIALAGLSIVNISFLTQMGLAAAATVAVAVLIALTLLPALLGFVGGRTGGTVPFVTAPDPEDPTVKNTVGRRWADLITKHRIKTLIGGLVVAGVVAIPVASMQLALPDDGTAADGSGPRVAYDLIAENFGAGTNGPLLVVVDTKNADDPAAAVSSVVEKVESIEKDVTAVVSPVPAADATPEAVEAFDGQLTEAQFASITVVPESGPSDADTQALVDDLRDAVATADGGAEVYVTGQTAVGVDISEQLAKAFPKYLLVVVGLAFILLLIVFRSVLVPLKAVAGFLLSVGVALGATVAVFQWGWFADLIGIDKSGPVLFMLPLLLTGILFGLAMDYEVFLVSRMREEFVHGREAKESVVYGFQYGARVVTAAAAIMIGVFGSFALGDEVIIKSIGFGLAVGVLADAFLVRMMIVPAFMALLGDRMWWMPAWLDRIVPNLDIEGESLARHLDNGAEGQHVKEPVPVA
ncbi:MAG: MMPL family transporter [Aeromicrobium sp.]